MNPNNPNNLDPNLRQAYESVMSGSQQSAQATPQPQTTNQPAAPMMQTEQVAENLPQTPTFQTPPPLPSENEDVMQSSVFKGGNMVNPNPSPQEAQETLAPKKKNKLLPVFLTIGGILFFVVYAVIWSKVFGLF